MSMFPLEIDSTKNILPQDGIVHYYGAVFSPQEINTYFNNLRNHIAWQHDEVIIMGKHITTKRKVAWYGAEAFTYTYSKITKTALPFTNILLAIKQQVEDTCNETFNSCLLNLYDDGNQAMGWHSDNEKELQPNGAIASVSFGAERKFMFKHKHTKETVSTVLHNGSLLVMKDVTQQYWQHRLPPSTAIKTPRINLTFRTRIL